jgi:calcineurin-like phosphoesterase
MLSQNSQLDNMIKIKDYLELEDSDLIRCANFIEYWEYKVPWKWYKILEKNWKKLLVIHLIWEVFMNFKVNNPFAVVEEIIQKTKNNELDWIIVDFHKEATAEFYGMWFFLDWKISFLFWTHTHIQTNDELMRKSKREIERHLLDTKRAKLSVRSQIKK